MQRQLQVGGVAGVCLVVVCVCSVVWQEGQDVGEM